MYWTVLGCAVQYSLCTCINHLLGEIAKKFNCLCVTQLNMALKTSSLVYKYTLYPFQPSFLFFPQ
jgi:hypothetical protein